MFPGRTCEGRGKTEKQHHSPEARAALELGGNLQYGSKIRLRFKIHLSKGKPSGAEGPGHPRGHREHLLFGLLVVANRPNRP